MNQRIKLHALSVSLIALSSGWVNAAEVNLYTTREPVLIQPLLDEFNQKTGIKVNTVFIKDGMLERVKTEGRRSPADVMLILFFSASGLIFVKKKNQSGLIFVTPTHIHTIRQEEQRKQEEREEGKTEVILLIVYFMF